MVLFDSCVESITGDPTQLIGIIELSIRWLSHDIIVAEAEVEAICGLDVMRWAQLIVINDGRWLVGERACLLRSSVLAHHPVNWTYPLFLWSCSRSCLCCVAWTKLSLRSLWHDFLPPQGFADRRPFPGSQQEETMFQRWLTTRKHRPNIRLTFDFCPTIWLAEWVD